MVSKASDDLPEPERPVMTTSLSRGMSTSTFLRLCTRAPRTAIHLRGIRTHYYTNLLSQHGDTKTRNIDFQNQNNLAACAHRPSGASWLREHYEVEAWSVGITRRRRCAGQQRSPDD